MGIIKVIEGLVKESLFCMNLVALTRGTFIILSTSFILIVIYDDKYHNLMI